MEITPQLVETITRQVLSALEQPHPSGPVACVFGDPARWRALEPQFTPVAADGCGEYALLLIDEISPAQLADLACGRADTPMTHAVSQALLGGIPVCLAAEGIAHRACKKTAQPAYYAMLEEYVSRLLTFGVRIDERAALGAKLGVKTPCAPAEDLLDGLVTAERARELARNCGGELRLAPTAKLTPLAKDLLREKKISLVWQKEEHPC